MNFKKGASEKNILERTKNLFLYDFIVCGYTIVLVFLIIWTSIGSSYINKEPSYSRCYLEDNGYVITAANINNVIMYIYIFCGIALFAITIIIYAYY